MGTKIIDQYSLLHLATGIVAFFWNISFKWWMLIHVIFELIENTKTGMKLINKFAYWPGGKPYADSSINMIGDNLFAAFGWLIAFGVNRISDKYNLYIN
jgi:hypothetical protein